MRTWRGFTVVELVVVMTIMAILLVVGIVSLAHIQSNGRDAERTSDAENIARGLERYYNGVVSSSESTIGHYPDRAVATAAAFTSSTLLGVDPSSFTYSFNNNASNFLVAPDPTGTTPAEDAAAIANYSSLTTNKTTLYVPMMYSTTNNR